MFYISIDIGKFDHWISVTNSDGEVLIEPFRISNDANGFNELLSTVSSFKSPRHIVGLEATGHYGDNLIRFLLDNDFEVGLINPISTDAKRKQKIRKTKNDKIDTFIIAQVMQDKNYTTVTKHKLETKQLKELTRYHASLTEDINQLKNQLQKCIDIVFPEFNSLFKSKYSRSYMALLKEFGNAYSIANAHLNHLKNVISFGGRGRRQNFDASLIRETAQNSIGENNEISTFKIKMLIESIELIEKQLDSVDKKIEESAVQLNSPITTIPGIGIYTGMCILSEIGDINCFDSSKKIVGYSGMDPATYQSGQYNAPTTALSKRGSRYLRKALYQCILPVCRFNPTFNTYYNLKRSQGKSHRCAQGHAIRKLIRVIFKLLSENCTFDAALLK
ncbi:IS110 family transposase [Anaerorhabdus sp.]|uniref:IS110 family transposase n=1 Tax=Anaerorhabdus sp. TaxID=1872524 RepID=UPI002FC5F90C